MKTKLINLLLSSPHGDAVREALRPIGDNVFTDVLYLRLHHLSDRQLACHLRAELARWGEDSTLSGEAIEVDVRFLGLVGLSFAHDDQHSEFEDLDVPLDIDFEHRFRILCHSFEVIKIRAYNYWDEPR